MAKLRAGEWFQNDGLIGVVVNARPDADGDVQVSYTDSNGKRSNAYPHASRLFEYERTDCERFISFPVAKRSDDYKFYALYASNGCASTALIVAGCRAFTIAEAKAYWKARDRTYLTDKSAENKALNAWSLAYVAKLEAHLKLVRAGKAK